jgi:Ion channel
MIVLLTIYGTALVWVTARAVLRPIERSLGPSQSVSESRWWYASRVVEAYLLLIGLFTAVYFQLAHTEPSAFQTPITHHMQAIYFTIGTFTTTGFGDIHPQRNLSEILVSAQMVVALIMIAVVVAGLTARLIESFRTDDAPTEGTRPESRRCDPQV